ncbi:P-loop containing nucleoside triphosphate hydrolase protein [Laetiporus sulphureus 93-53]|uniref:RNA helicase n=1 Tax=Laetiporus sulphureus 93-53 TaxID=1314785 RepID=A0A165HPX1_9APHY|nr:P-loop containing nucleoside triphosphate hydrolase protein [Laetiporus sulphureus 93-53]KZT12027.1 P-loop containing nucleoside triphosphate hydrolase protein [Laetiporus sulphureus 93-53]
MDRRQRYNAKARQSTVGSHKKGKRKAKDEAPILCGKLENPNAEIIIPKPMEQKELERKERMKQELLAQSNSKANSKKRKRLEKYIEKKLKQEERVLLFEKLSKSQAEVSTALQLQSSSTLGTGKVITHKDLMDKQEDKEVRRAMDGLGMSGKRRHEQRLLPPAEDSEDGGDEDDDMNVDEEQTAEQVMPEGTSRSNPVVVVDSGFTTAILPPESSHSAGPTVTVIGSALKHNADGSVVAPRVVKRNAKRTKRTLTWKSRGPVVQTNVQDVDHVSDTSFDSSDSACDSRSEQEDEEGQADDGKQKASVENTSSHEDEISEGGHADLNSGNSNRETVETSAVGEQAGVKRKSFGFKEWASKQLSNAKSYVVPIESESFPTSAIPTEPGQHMPPPKKKQKMEASSGEMRGPLGEELKLPATLFAEYVRESGPESRDAVDAVKRKTIIVTRQPEVEDARLLLPIVAEEQPIMEAILFNRIVIICGETGSGKTTQVPQFLYEAGFGSPDSDNPGMIGVTQPRRVAAISMANRVAQELSLTSSHVSYQIRYDATVSPSTSIKFMTDGVLLRELAADFLLTKYSVIIIDEAHERSMNTDILIGVLSRIVKLREDMWRNGKDNTKPLRLIIMSATLRVSDFAENKTLFSTPPPVINVPARQHPVTVHFSRRTSPDYVTDAIRKASKIHARLPPGGILIFLTGQNEITGVCRKLEARYGKKALDERQGLRRSVRERSERLHRTGEEAEPQSNVIPSQADIEAEDIDLSNSQTDRENLALDVDDDNSGEPDDPDAFDSDGDGDEALGIDVEESDVPMHIVPLYALLPSEKQLEVFRPPPPGSRLVVVATNVAETSLTIPNIRYVIDCGRVKERRYEMANGVQAFQVSWVSKASAAQRAGRAGRTGPGHCYRLYSSALYERYFEPFSQPEILRVPIDGVVLQMKSMNIDAVVNFPFPTPPDRTSLRKAEKMLTHLGALKPQSSGSSVLSSAITEIGKSMSLFPLSPRYSRMLVSGRQHGCLPYIVTIVSALSVGDPFVREEALVNDAQDDEDGDEELSHLSSEATRAKEARRLRRRAFFQSQQIHASLGNATSDVLRMLSIVGAYEYAGGGHQFCTEHFVRPKAMEEIHKLRAQISSIVQTNFPELETGFVANLPPPNNLQACQSSAQLIAAGFIDQVAARKDLVQRDTSSGNKYTTSKGVPYQAIGVEEDVFIHPSSVLANRPPPDFVVYLEVVRTSRIWIKGLTVVNAAWLPSLGKSLCTYSKAGKTKDGRSMMIPHFGPGGWELPPVEADR